MAISISIRKINKFEIPNGKTEVKKADVPLGSITKTNQTLTINGIIFNVFNCSFSKDITDDITVFIAELDDYKSLESYKKKFDFKMYYSKDKKLLFSDSTTPITKSFLKTLAATPKITLDFNTIHFDLKSISEQCLNTKGVRFNSQDPGITAKSLSGGKVDINPEANDALENDDATQVIGVMQVGKQDYTVMITQSGTIMSFSKLLNYEDKEHPMLEFAINLLDKIKYI